MPLCLSFLLMLVGICGHQLRQSALPRHCRVFLCAQPGAVVSEHGENTEKLDAIILSFRASVSLHLWLMLASLSKAGLQAKRKKYKRLHRTALFLSFPGPAQVSRILQLI